MLLELGEVVRSAWAVTHLVRRWVLVPGTQHLWLALRQSVGLAVGQSPLHPLVP